MGTQKISEKVDINFYSNNTRINVREVWDPMSSIEIIDNENKLLAKYIRHLLRQSDNAKFAVGYFFLSGWNVIKEGLPENPPKEFLKIVIGRETSPETLQELSKGHEEQLNVLKFQLLRDISQYENPERLRDLYYLIQKGIVDVKIYTKKRLHSKLYLFLSDRDTEKGAAIVGSSNLTSAGLSLNKELNVLLTDPQVISELDQWFEELWEESEDFKEELMRILEISTVEGINLGKFVTPRELFKVLAWRWFEGRIEPIEKQNILAEFQVIGVVNAIRTISNYNGVIIADSVGLGKSFIGASIIEEYIKGKLPQWDPKNYGYNDKERKALLLLPPSLIPQWEHLLFNSGFFFTKNDRVYVKPEHGTTERFKRYKIYQKTPTDLVQLGEVAILSIDKFSTYNSDKIKELGLNYEYDLILIDEAHRLRNRATKRWKNSRMLRFKDDKNKEYQNKFILLTATPLNNTIWDIYNLIKIFSDDLFSAFKMRGVNVTQLFEEFKQIKKKWKENPSKYEGQLRMKAQEIKEKVLDEVMILRTRKYILETFGEDGKIKIGERELVFNDPIPEKVLYNDITGGDYKHYWEFIKSLPTYFDRLKFSYTKLYTSGYVVLGNSSSSLFSNAPEDTEEETVRVPIPVILKLLISKRLESSIFAFERTMQRMYTKNSLFYTALLKFSKRMDKLSPEEFKREILQLGNEFLSIAGKEDIINILNEENLSKDENGQTYNPRLQMLVNILLAAFDNLRIPLPEFQNEEEFFKFIFSKKLFNKFKLGVRNILSDLQSDQRTMEEILSNLDKLKKRDETGKPITVGKIVEQNESYPIYVYQDPKLEKLKQLMREELINMKYIIFTQYKDTAKYIYHNLLEWATKQYTLSYLWKTTSKGIQPKIGLVTGEMNVEEKEKIIKRFAPKSNQGEDITRRYGEIKVLVSTDSLSEGVNLQDADAVVNYDLPWNPMIIVQRVGRVSRIGNEKEVKVKNFVPVDEIEVSLGVLAKLQEKIKDITLLVGKEFYILSEDEEITVETFGEKLRSLAELRLTQLEEFSTSEEFKLMAGGIPSNVLEEFELLDYIQNKLKLRKKDFEDIHHLLNLNQPLYTFIDEGNLIAVLEIYRGNKLAGRKIVSLNGNVLEEKGCSILKKLWEHEDPADLPKGFKTIGYKLQLLSKMFEKNVLPQQMANLKQKGFVKDLYNYLREYRRQALLDSQVNKNDINKALTYLAWAELNPKEVRKLKEHLIRVGGLKMRGKKILVVDVSKLVQGVLEYFRAGEMHKNITYNIIGWWV